MKKKNRKKLYDYGARTSVIIHFISVIAYFVFIPFLFIKGTWRLIAAAYIIITWIQYRILKGCVFTHTENFFLKKAGRKTHKHFISRQAHKWVRGYERKDKDRFKQIIDRGSQNFKTIFFVIAIISLVLYFI